MKRCLRTVDERKSTDFYVSENTKKRKLSSVSEFDYLSILCLLFLKFDFLPKYIAVVKNFALFLFLPFHVYLRT